MRRQVDGVGECGIDVQVQRLIAGDYELIGVVLDVLRLRVDRVYRCLW